MSTSGMLRPDNAIFYHPLDDLTEYTQIQTWSGTGGFVDGKIGDAASAIAGENFVYGDISTLSTSITMAEHAMDRIDDTHFLIAYRENTSGCQLRVGTVSDNNISWGPMTSGSTAYAGAQNTIIGLAMLDSTTFVVGHRRNGTAKQIVRVGTLDGTDITLGPECLFDANVGKGCRLVKLDATHAILAYGDGTTGDGVDSSGNVRLVTVSGNEVSFGPASTFEASYLQYESIGVAPIDSTHALVSWTVADGQRYVYASVITVSGSNLVVESPTIVDGNLPSYLGVGILARTIVRRLGSTNKYALAWEATADGSSGRSRILTVSGTTITTGSEERIMRDGFLGEMCALNDSQFVATFESVNFASRAPAYRIGNVSGTTITYNSNSTPHTGSGPDDKESFAVVGIDDYTMVGVVTRNVSTQNTDAVVGHLISAANIAAQTSESYPTISGCTRLVNSMWIENFTSNISEVNIERGVKLQYQGNTDLQIIASGGGSGYAQWIVSGLGTILNDTNDHLLVVDIEHVSGTVWNLSTSVDGSPFVDRGNSSGSLAVPTTDSLPRLSISNGVALQWIDELTLWAGDKSTFPQFTNKELSNLHNLGEMISMGLENYDTTLAAKLFISGPNPVTTSGNLFSLGHQQVDTSGNLFGLGHFNHNGSAVLYTYGINSASASISNIIHGHQSLNQNIDLFINSIDDATSSCDLYVNGHDAVNSSSNLFAYGYNTINTSCNLVTIGHLNSNISATLYTYGVNNVSTSIPDIIHGHQEIANSGDLFVVGRNSVDTSSSLIIIGHNQLTTSINLYQHGYNITNSSGNLFTYGYNIADASGNLVSTGHLSHNISGVLYIYGFDNIVSSSISLSIGHQPIELENDLFIYGIDDIDDSHNLFTHGHIPQSTSGNLYQYGHDIVNESSDLFIHGYNIFAVSGDLISTGHLLHNVSGDLYIYGLDNIVSSGISLSIGHQTAQLESDLFISGLDNINDSVDLYTIGHQSSSGLYDAYIYGYDVITGLVTSFLHGQDTAITSGDLFINGYNISNQTSDLFINGLIESSGIPAPSLFIHGHSSINNSGDLFVAGFGPVSKQCSLFLNGEAAVVFHKRIDWLLQTSDHNPQIIGVLDSAASSATIEIWDITNGINQPVNISVSGCYSIGNTSRWGWSTAHLPLLSGYRKHYYYRMTSNLSDTFEGEFLLDVPESAMWAHPSIRSEYIK